MNPPNPLEILHFGGKPMEPLGPLFLSTTNLFRKLLSELTKRGRLFAKEKVDLHLSKTEKFWCLFSPC